MIHDDFMGDLQEAERPGILVGGGAYKARDAIMAFAAQHSIPVFRTWNALDVVTDDDPCYGGTVGTYGGPGRNFGIQNTDLLLILGCRISGRITGGSPHTFARAAKRYWVDPDYSLMHEHEVKPHRSHEGTAEDFIGRCSSGRYAEWHLDFSIWLRQCVEWVSAYDPVTPQMVVDWHHYGFMRALSGQITRNAIITYDTGGNAIMMGHCFKSKRGQRIFSSNGNTPMGFSMCGAIGAWFAEPNRPVVCIIGDGGMQMNIQELQTVVNYGIPLKVFVINNGVLGNTKAYQRVNGKLEICCGPDGYSAPVFPNVANAYGIESATLGEWERFDAVVSKALSSERAIVVDVLDHDRCNYEPRVSRWDTPIEDMQSFLPRHEFRENLFIDPVEGWEKNK